MHYYYHHIGDFIKDTSFLTNEELGIYMKLIWLYYDSESPLDNNANTLAVKIGARDKVNQVEGILNLFFKLENNKWHQSRCDREIESYKKQADAGKRGAEKRWGSHKGGIATPYPPHSHPIPTPIATNNQEPLTNNHINTPEGVDVSLWKEFLAHRKKLKAPVTETVIKRLTKETEKAKMTLNEVIEIILFKGWRSFEADWVKNEKKHIKQDDKSWMFSNEGIVQKARELGVSDYGVANHAQLKEKILLVMAKRSME